MKVWGIIDFPYKNENTQEINENDPLTRKWRYICMAVMALLIYPINYTRNLAALRYFSMGILMIVLYTIFVRLLLSRLPFSSSHTTTAKDT